MIRLFFRYLFVYFIIHNLVNARRHKHYFETSNKFNDTEEALKLLDDDVVSPLEKTYQANEKVVIQMYYESLSPECIQFHNQVLMPVVRILSRYIRVMTYPFGIAQVSQHQGRFEFKCQHGPEECYGNKLHACTLALITNRTQALIFNTCMMGPKCRSRGSDDFSADACGNAYKVDSSVIKECAKSTTGDELFKFFGEESTKVNYHYVPYVLINGKPISGDNFLRSVCAAYIKPPPACHTLH